MKKYFYLIITFFLLCIFNGEKIYANSFIISDKYYFINNVNEIKVYKNNVYYETINGTLIDANDTNILYGIENTLFLYSLDNKTYLRITDVGYNAMLVNNFVIYESDNNSNFKCKNLVGALTYRNCYKLYLYNIINKETNMLSLNGDDNYINDVNNNLLAYTSIHTRDEVCNSICSFINIYDFTNQSIITINQYEGLVLDMSGNAKFDNDLLYFESVPNIYGYNYTQIFIYNLTSRELEVVTCKDSSCFNENSEIIDANEGYLLFRSKYGNYDNNEEINYVYSYDDKLYANVDENILYEPNISINNHNIWMLKENVLTAYVIDDEKPFINDLKSYTALLENKEKLINKLEYSDNLSKNENIDIKLIDDIDKIGEYFIKIKACDKFNNCIIKDVLVNVIDVDVTPPRIYCEESITIKNNEELNIEKYGYAIDNVDGKIALSIVGKNVYSKKGTYILLLESKDSSGNVSYKEVELVVYDELRIIYIYLVIIVISISLVVIIYILRFKKGR